MNIEEMQAQRDADYEKYKAEGRIWGTVPREKIVQIQIPWLQAMLFFSVL